MQVPACSKLITGLDRTAWTAIFEISDADQHLGLDAGQAELTLVAYGDRLVQRVTFFSNTDEWTPNERHKKVSVRYSLQLRLAHCLVVASEVLLEFIAKCLELRCAKLVAEPPAIFRLLSQRLVCLKMMRWSLCEDGRYGRWLEKDAVADISAQCQLQTLKLDTTYAESVASPPTADLLNNVSNGWDDQQRPCIHAIRKDAAEMPISNVFTKLKTVRRGLHSSRHTCERARPPATILCAEASCCFVRPEDGASLRGVRHAVVALELPDASSEAIRNRKAGAVSLGSPPSGGGDSLTLYGHCHPLCANVRLSTLTIQARTASQQDSCGEDSALW